MFFVLRPFTAGRWHEDWINCNSRMCRVFYTKGYEIGPVNIRSIDFALNKWQSAKKFLFPHRILAEIRWVCENHKALRITDCKI